MKKKFLIGAVIIVVLLLIVCLNVKKGKGKIPSVTVTTVKRGEVRATVRAEGELRAKNQVEIGTDVMGRIIKIFAEEGDWKEKGEVLCVIDPKVYEAKVNQIRSKLSSDLARLRQQERTVERAADLLKKNLISEAEFEDLSTEYEILKATVKADSFALEEALQDLEKTTIKAPISGEVISVNKEEGEMAVVGTIGTPGSTIMVLADCSEMLISALVDETEVVKVEVGQRVDIRIDAYPDSVFTGYVTSIRGMPRASILSSTQEGVSYPVEVRIEETGCKLYPGMSATCDIIVAHKKDVLFVPFTALGKREVNGKSRDVVFKLSEGRAMMVPLVLGVSSERAVEIIEGLSEGDTVLTGPFQVLRTLEDGDPVAVEEEKKFDHRGKRAH